MEAGERWRKECEMRKEGRKRSSGTEEKQEFPREDEERGWVGKI